MDLGDRRVTHLKAIISPQVNEKEDKLNAAQDAPKEHSRRGYVAHVREIRRCFEMNDRRP